MQDLSVDINKSHANLKEKDKENINIPLAFANKEERHQKKKGDILAVKSENIFPAVQASAFEEMSTAQFESEKNEIQHIKEANIDEDEDENEISFPEVLINQSEVMQQREVSMSSKRSFYQGKIETLRNTLKNLKESIKEEKSITKNSLPEAPKIIITNDEEDYYKKEYMKLQEENKKLKEEIAKKNIIQQPEEIEDITTTLYIKH